ncbi:MAG: hypothetical protein COT24_01415, partial [Candidatus Kerfeldbacteria bacterium CG08_land_8_20_14_0_20_40_16]
LELSKSDKSNRIKNDKFLGLVNKKILLAAICVAFAFVFCLLIIRIIQPNLLFMPLEIGLVILIDLYLAYQALSQPKNKQFFLFWVLIALATFDISYLLAKYQYNSIAVASIHAYPLALLIGLGFWLHPISLHWFKKISKGNKERDNPKRNTNGGEDETERIKQKRWQEIRQKFPTLSTIPLLRTLIRWGCGNGWIKFAVFCVIIVIYIIIRLPYFNDSFFIRLHPDKNVSYVPAAQEMYNAKNPFVFRNPAYTGVFETMEEQQYKSFWRMPVLEWTLAPFFALENYFSNEEIVRIYLTLAGIFILLNVYILIRKIFSSFVALSVTFLFSLTPLFNLLTWITTLDLPALVFLLVALNLYFHQRKELAFLMLGFALTSKLSFIVIGLPIFCFLILFTEKERIIYWIKLALLAFLPLGLFNVFLQQTPSQPDRLTKNLLLFFLYLISLGVAFIIIKGPFTRLLQKIQKLKSLWYISLGVTGVILVILLTVILQKYFLSLSDQFLTDSRLILISDFYTVLLSRICFMSIPTVMLLFIIALVLCWTLPRNKLKILFSFFLASLVFLVMASKSIRFAWYYNHFFILTIFLFVAGLFYQIEKQLSCHRYLKVLLIAIILAASSLHLYPKPAYVLENKLTQDHIQQLISIIEENTNNGSKILIYASEYRTLFLYNNKLYLQLGAQNDPAIVQKIKNDIKELGFYEAMNKYNINLMVDKRYQDNFISLTSLFSEDIDQDAYNRTKIIQSKLFKNKNNYDEDTRNLYNELNIKRYFKNIGSVQDVAIYKIIESSSSL